MEIIANLEQTKELIKTNLAANEKLTVIKRKLNKSSIESFYMILGVVLGLLSMVTVNALVQVFVVRIFLTNHLLIGMLLATGLGVGSLIWMIFMFKKIGFKQREKLVEKRFNKMKNEIELINEEISKTYSDCDTITILPPKYRNLHAVDKIKEYVQNKRADSLKEAINLYEDELLKMQQMRMLSSISQLQNQMVQAQHRTNNQLAWQSFLISTRNFNK
jgi:hypothetical protein